VEKEKKGKVEDRVILSGIIAQELIQFQLWDLSCLLFVGYCGGARGSWPEAGNV
jgi:hypothetical protein